MIAAGMPVKFVSERLGHSTYEEGLTPEDWLWQNFGALPAILEGQPVDIGKFVTQWLRYLCYTSASFGPQSHQALSFP
jgi:hypothetical protein